MGLLNMFNDAVKKLQKEKRVLTLGQLVDAICSGDLRKECELDRNAFAELVGTTRKTIREYEAWEKSPQMRMIFNMRPRWVLSCKCRGRIMAMIDIEENITSNAADILAIAEARAAAENLLGNTLSRHRSAINALADALNGSPDRIVRPGYWVSLYAREPSTSTVISNMKFVASILEWTEGREYENGAQYLRIAQAIRLALAVKA